MELTVTRKSKYHTKISYEIQKTTGNVNRLLCI